MEDQDFLAITIGENIARLRRLSNMTQSELAEKINYSDKSVSKWEQGNGIPDVRILLQLAELFNVSVDDLVREHKEAPVMPKKTRLRRRIIISLLSVGLCWLVAVVAFVFIGIIWPDVPNTWLAFVYAVPASAIVVLVFSCIWRYRWVRIAAITVLIWLTLTCIYLTAHVCGAEIGLIYFIGVPLQILALIFFVPWKSLHPNVPRE
ncbi:MAG TPA: helix-turn-helix domain-containing protein [Firmicutes bacterium]|nr:helix-turn-helix domain-containing protein [Bacillota bacterium]